MEPMKLENTIEIKDLMVLASYNTLKSFDSSGLNYHLNDNEGLLNEIAEKYATEFKTNLVDLFDKQVLLLPIDQLQSHLTED